MIVLVSALLATYFEMSENWTAFRREPHS